MLDKIIIVDFEDSFTFNIANVLFPYEKNCVVVPHSLFFHSPVYENINSKCAVILGPGPGHPDEHLAYYGQIKKLMNNPHVYLMGVCLGHQLMGRVDGKDVRSAEKQMHGQTVTVYFSGEKIKVQRYNSLAVFEDGHEVNIKKYPQGVSYQFHPESVGTENSLIFFKDLLDFITLK